MLRRMGWNNVLERGIRKSLNRNEERERREGFHLVEQWHH